ncbi:Ribosome-binding ATPase YchF [Candidatus Tiddalikarchaeum anstoanum]|nr:Ribosome-binding ATPase YchF [Candidatus Tiddalikarchaeum anstoanum]
MIIGIVGKPSSGKSTFFKACTMSNVEITGHPFTTIKPNQGVGYVRVECPCKKAKVKCDPQNSYCRGGERFVPVRLLDVAGLVPGAHEGKGLGNQFLDDLRNADCLIHVIDASGMTNAVGDKTMNHDPYFDINFLDAEIHQWFKGIIIKNFSMLTKKATHFGDSIIQVFSEPLTGLKISSEDLKKALVKSNLNLEKVQSWTLEDYAKLSVELKNISKPMLIVANKADVPASDEFIKNNKDIIPCSALAETVLRDLNEKGIIEYVPGDSSFKVLKKDELDDKLTTALDMIKKRLFDVYNGTGVQKALNNAVFNLMHMKVAYPVEDEHKLSDSKGHVLPTAILLDENATAEDLAYKIHSDIGKNFIRAIDCKTKMVIGKNHVLKNGDIVKIYART